MHPLVSLHDTILYALFYVLQAVKYLKSYTNFFINFFLYSIWKINIKSSIALLKLQ
jgi:hypothetical protein